ncbi:glutamate synthase-related protein [Halococcoides cellulosivorans]|uniref:FMN-binding glutamate synthase family protein n=1 Tax=Halococcoides cellulosivorans TaxID=1679096 RepID=A0A2R4X328_9EURY|nr:glutamate synthase-related protein [Halococcoides cellulosivorans]AWB28211.1 FMN-binding glutamate synthase family protein [Halococcoides cellulosivorans]
MPQYDKRDDVLDTTNRGDPAESGLCTLCTSDCVGSCETWMSSLRGREMLYPRRYGDITAGARNATTDGVSYESMRIQGYAHGAEGLPEGVSASADDALYTNVDLETEFGAETTTKCKLPLMTGALGSTFIAEKYWESFAVGAALRGFPIVIGENVVAVDRESTMEDGRVVDSPELDRRIETYNEYADDEYGAIIVQMNVEDQRNGVAEYVAEEHGNDVIIELKWGQGAKDIGGEIQVDSIEYAQFLKDRGYVVDPDPTKEAVQKAYREGNLEHFARHSRLGATEAPEPEDVERSFLETVEYLRELGFERITLKTGAYSNEDLALAMRCASKAELDLLTIDGAGGGTGMSPWNMMQEWGTPSVHIHSKALEYAELMDDEGQFVPDLAFAGGIATEDQIFKTLALGSPYVKLVCMGRALMIPGFVGTNVEGALHPDRREQINGTWEDLPPTVTEYGETPEQIFSGWQDVDEALGEQSVEDIPYGAVALWNLTDKLGAGLKQLMAGARKFSIDAIERSDLMAENEETARVTDLPLLTEAYDEEAKALLKSASEPVTADD